MMNRDEMLRKYEAKTAARAYIIGFEWKGFLYTIFTKSLDCVNDRIVLDRASKSHGGMAKIRIRLDKWAKARLAGKATNHGPISVLEYAGKYNAGERFERFVYELNGRTWAKDSRPFWAAGDIELNGLQIQIKFDGAELTNERTLATL